MICKYCHLNGHIIDKCPTIICKNCRDVGHPQWLCKLKKNKANGMTMTNNEDSKNKKFSKKNITNLDNKYLFTDEIKKKEDIKDTNNDNVIVKNISYYIKLKDNEWGQN